MSPAGPLSEHGRHTGPSHQESFDGLLPHSDENTPAEDLVWCRVTRNSLSNGSHHGKPMRVYDQISTVNHSCIPNAVVNFNEDIKMGTLHCLREISEGEEVLIDYLGTNTFRTRESRRQALRDAWEFERECPACEMPEGTKVSIVAREERFRVDIGNIRRRLLVGTWETIRARLRRDLISMCELKRYAEMLIRINYDDDNLAMM